MSNLVSDLDGLWTIASIGLVVTVEVVVIRGSPTVIVPSILVGHQNVLPLDGARHAAKVRSVYKILAMTK